MGDIMRKTFLVLFASTALLGGVPVMVHAETLAAAAPDAATQRKIDLVDRYFKAVHFNEMMDNMMKSMMPAMVDSMRQQYPQMSPELSQALSESSVAVMAEFIPEFQKETVVLYAEAFSEEELTQLVNFYESPVGQSIMAKSNAMMPKVTQLAVKMMPGVQAKMMDRLCSKIDCKALKPAA